MEARPDRDRTSLPVATLVFRPTQKREPLPMQRFFEAQLSRAQELAGVSQRLEKPLTPGLRGRGETGDTFGDMFDRDRGQFRGQFREKPRPRKSHVRIYLGFSPANERSE
jgi:hypothetical protein